MRYLVIGSGGREHALAWRLLYDGSASEVYVLPGNGGIDPRYRVNISMNDFHAIEEFCSLKKIDCVVVGPEIPLVGGIVDFCESKKIPAFGPCASAARLEGSKLFAKSIMEKYGIPTCRHWDFTGQDKLLSFVSDASYPLVIKLDGLAAGKGVAIPQNRSEAEEFIQANVQADTRVFVEEFFDGEEASVLGITDGETIRTLVAAQDHKRVFDKDQGPNTGGMGAYAPAPVVTDGVLQRVLDGVLKPTIEGMKKEGTPFRGILYAGIMIRGEEIRVLEFNARFGDPETQVILPLIDGRLGDLIQASLTGRLTQTPVLFQKKHAITVVLASGGYPGSYPVGREISGLDSLGKDVIAFHAGTREENGKYFTSGGRVLALTAMGNTLGEARDRVYSEIGRVRFEGMHYRTDIGHRALR